MALTRDLSSRAGKDALQRRCSFIRDALIRDGLYEVSPDHLPHRETEESAGTTAVTTRWRIAPGPFVLTTDQVAFFRSLGNHLLTFYKALNRLYLESVRGTQPAWVSAYLDQGKPEALVSYSRMRRFRDLLPGVIRPDIIPTEEGMVITELDSVPGGIGLTGALARAYSEWPIADSSSEGSLFHHTRSSSEPSAISHQPSAPASKPSAISHQPTSIVGGADGIILGFARMLRDQLGDRPGCVAIVVSEEAKGYRPEMAWLAARLSENGVEAFCVEPREVRFTEDALLVSSEAGERPVSVVYRFFELFDLKNVPKSELIMYSAKKDRATVTPPFKPQLEEKLAFALLHHPILAPFWRRELGDDTLRLLTGLMPRTWILDPRPLPPSAVIPDLHVAGRAVADWRDLAEASQKDRRYVVKPSGFSELAWGSRGVSVGHDLPQTEWAAALDAALASFPTTPYILQEFHKGRQYDLSYYDARADEMVPMPGRARLSPYYFVSGDRAELSGVLATVCPLDKKVIHGMRDAIMLPCAVKTSAE
ncbi:MAG: hypothetical protein HY581_05210 [Nitrospirae bacterium]|nr:hypothetical protein [Nitrospirota bacterium]